MRKIRTHIPFTKRGWRPKLKWLKGKPFGCRTWGIIGLVVLIIGGLVVCANSGPRYSLPRAMNLGTAPSQVLASPTSQVLASPTSIPSQTATNQNLCQEQACEGLNWQSFGGCTWPYTNYVHVMVQGSSSTDIGSNIFEVQQLKSNNCVGAKRIVIRVPAAVTYLSDSIATATSQSYYSSLDVGSALPGGAMLAGGQVHQDFVERQPGDYVWYSSMFFQFVHWDIKGARKTSLTSVEQSGELSLNF